MSEPTVDLARDYSLDEVAAALGMSTRWVRDRIKQGERGEKSFVEHTRRGHKIRFTAEQVEKLRMADAQAAPIQSVTTGKKRTKR
jgi:predicted DNA-binding protein YlxM (UPF0122 family)